MKQHIKKRYAVETYSRSRKNVGFRIFYADNIEQVKEKMKQLRLPILNIICEDDEDNIQSPIL